MNTESRTATANLLVAARKVVERPEAWCRTSWGKTVNGDRVAWNHPDCVCRCAEGAVRFANFQLKGEWRLTTLAERALARAFAGMPTPECVAKFNDDSTHEQVLAAFDRAIKQCAVGDRESDATPQTVA